MQTSIATVSANENTFDIYLDTPESGNIHPKELNLNIGRLL